MIIFPMIKWILKFYIFIFNFYLFSRLFKREYINKYIEIHRSDNINFQSIDQKMDD